jgi:hypothetical protein
MRPYGFRVGEALVAPVGREGAAARCVGVARFITMLL